MMRTLLLLCFISLRLTFTLASYDYHEDQNDEPSDSCPSADTYLRRAQKELVNPFGYNNCDKGLFRYDWMKKIDSFHCQQRRSSANFRSAGRKGSLRIEHGYKAMLGEFPSYVRLIERVGKEVNICGGIVLNDYLVLTAAHCISGFGSIEVRGGNVTIGVFETGVYQSSRAIQYCKPIEWETTKENVTLSYDWAILELEQRLKFNEYLQPACVNMDFELKPDVACVAIGHGIRYIDQKEDTKDLRAAVVRTKCTRPPWVISELSEEMDTPPMENAICVSPSDVEGEGQACAGDSGGPLYCFENCSGRPKMYAVGVAHKHLPDAANHKCGYHSLAFYTTTSSHRYQLASTIRNLMKQRRDRKRRNGLKLIPGTSDRAISSSIECYTLDP